MSILNFKKSPPKADPSQAEKKKVEAPVGAHGPANFGLIRKAWLSEKAGDLGKFNQYVFLVQNSANKKEVEREVGRRYGVKVKGVNIIREPGKTKRVGNVAGRTSGFKKAIVTLKDGEKLEIS
ncbi:MAG: 50S ribosomal protein L23 [Candidatus Jorgensenbacteria bacterium GW2011_GWC1_48_8]|uniref:Large ribosomal subunit protein uL23 n=2 Tax=Candidatus Joergenseniibacteriota TaxID=1752739 RepID=A0A0G1Z7K9_9BACT|nr:MAG: 50S ribosomal protein L23 [Candidatus Jorgensenbacteria bacterium GW2011_GWC1_48_8]KKW14954.1 MAG: 50S ribosomal protein L23 [Candidatus Jorgensenbacteria bacterium GW2011_GWB1_50_10]